MELPDQIGRFESVRWVPATGSTNRDLVELARAGDVRPAVLFTDHQTAGRGRRDRRWEMKEAGGLLVSFFVPWSDAGTVHRVPTALGVAAIDAISATLGSAAAARVHLKWPNDLVDDEDAKIGGMLSEIITESGSVGRSGPGILGVVCGFGLNVRWSPDLSTGAAASLEEVAGVGIDRRTLGVALCEAFDRVLVRLHSEPPERLADRFRAHCSTIGRTVRIEMADGADVGRVTDVDANGRLVLEIGGRLRTYEVGDVVHLRPEDA